MVIAAGWDWKIETGIYPKPWHPVKNITANFDCKPSYWQPTLRSAFCALPTSAPRTTLRLTTWDRVKPSTENDTANLIFASLLNSAELGTHLPKQDENISP
jgi:hypothetical protein